MLSGALGLESQLSGFPWERQRKPSSWDLLGAAAREGVSAFSLFRDGRCCRDSQLLGPMVGDRALARALVPALSGLCLGTPVLEQDDLWGPCWAPSLGCPVSDEVKGKGFLFVFLKNK